MSSSDNRYVAYGVERSINSWFAYAYYLVDAKNGDTQRLPDDIDDLLGISTDGQTLMYVPEPPRRCHCENDGMPRTLLDLATGDTELMPAAPLPAGGGYVDYFYSRLAADGRSAVTQADAYDTSTDKDTSHIYWWKRGTADLVDGPTPAYSGANMGGIAHEDLTISGDGTSVAYGIECGQPGPYHNPQGCLTIWHPATGETTRISGPAKIWAAINESAISENGRWIAWSARTAIPKPHSTRTVDQMSVWVARTDGTDKTRLRAVTDGNMVGDVSVSNNGLVYFATTSPMWKWVYTASRAHPKPRLVTKSAYVLGYTSTDGRSVTVISRDPHHPRDSRYSMDLYLLKRR